jgi:hypothetical protein
MSQLLWSSGNITDTNWYSHTADLFPLANYSQFILTAQSLDTSGTYSPYIMVDNLSDITPAGPGVYIGTTPVNCLLACNGTATAQVFGATPPLTFLWSPGGQTTQSITGLCQGTYSVVVTDSNNLTYSDTATVTVASNPTPPVAIPICMVSVDSATQKNKVIWDKPVSNEIISFTIYRETSIINQFDPIGSVPYANLSEFIDNSSAPAQQAYRYKLGYLDTCGNTSSLSALHKTIHLLVSPGMLGSYQLHWNLYEGFYYSSFNIYRGPSINQMTLLTSIAGNMDSYTDLTPPTGTLYYMVCAVRPTACNPWLKSNWDLLSRSNCEEAVPIGIDGTADKGAFSVYPNPASDGFVVECPNGIGCITLRLFDMMGREQREYRSCDQEYIAISTAELSQGVYTIIIESPDISSSLKLVVEH